MENNRFWNITATIDSGQTLHAMIPTAFDSSLAIQRMFAETSWYQRQDLSDYNTRRERYEKAIMDVVLLSEWELERQRNQYALERFQAFKPTIQNTVLWNDAAFQDALYAVERYL
jgi:hypothetical protein